MPTPRKIWKTTASRCILASASKRCSPDRVMLSDGDTIMTHTVVWGGGEKPADVIGAANCRRVTAAGSTWNQT